MQLLHSPFPCCHGTAVTAGYYLVFLSFWRRRLCLTEDVRGCLFAGLVDLQLSVSLSLTVYGLAWNRPSEMLKWKAISELRSVTCRMGSHSVSFTWHVWTRPFITPVRQAGTRFTYPGGIESRVHFGICYILDGLPVCRQSPTQAVSTC